MPSFLHRNGRDLKRSTLLLSCCAYDVRHADACEVYSNQIIFHRSLLSNSIVCGLRECRRLRGTLLRVRIRVIGG